MHAENHPDQQPGADHRQSGEAVVQQFAGGFQVFAAGQFEGDGCQAGNCRNAHHEQHQPGVLVLDFGNAFHISRFRTHDEPGHQDQVSPDPGIPADEYFADDRIGRNQDTRCDTERRGGGQARVGVAEVGHERSMGRSIANTLAQVSTILKSPGSPVGASLLAIAV
ncbi:hypothetical protein D3C87_1544150 [compost metagenome]